MNDREYGRQYGRDKSADPQEIGPPPDVVNPARRGKTEASLERFLKLYFPWAFTLKWSPDHIRVIDKIEEAIISGGLFSLAMPRGSGKTTISERAGLWAILTGRRKFVTLVGATESHAEQILKSQMTELRYNDFLHEDFPEACHPIRALENEPRRCKGQKCEGENTNIVWTASQLVFPSLPEKYRKPCNGSIVSVCGVTGAIRGQKHTTTTGEILRPSFVLIDDPQTREAAESESQCRSREAIIAGDVLGMAGPGQKISAVMPCTVIRKGDMADELLNRERHPDWNGERTKLLTSLPTDQKAIDTYAQVRAEALRGERPQRDINKHWRKNRIALESGALASWPERKNPDDVSAIQHAVNLLLRDRAAFFAEYQNEPIEQLIDAERLPTADEICAKLSHVPRGELALEWQHVTGFIDVQKEALFWCVAGWGDNFSGGIVDYGCFPEQGRHHFTYSDLSASLSKLYPGKPLEAVLFAGLDELTKSLCGREWKRADGSVLRLERLLIDSGYQTEVVHQFCRWSPHAAVLMPSKGIGISAGNKPLNEYQRRPGEGKPGLNWRPSLTEGRKAVLIDTNFWKSFFYSRLVAPMGGAGCLSLFGDKPNAHRLLADHLTAEYTVKTFGRGRDVIEWKPKPGRPDNHWLDCAVGCAVAASMGGVSVTQTEIVRKPKPRVPLAQMGARR